MELKNLFLLMQVQRIIEHIDLDLAKLNENYEEYENIIPSEILRFLPKKELPGVRRIQYISIPTVACSKLSCA